MNLAAIDLNLLKAFEALLVEKRVKLAASRLGITQPAMSNALRRLRYLFNDELFLRSPAGMIPTARARDLADPITRALQEIRTALDGVPAFDPERTERKFAVGITDFSVVGLALALAERVQRLAPKACLQICYVEPANAPDPLANEVVDILVGVKLAASNQLTRRSLFTETASFLMRDGHPAAADYSLETLLSYPHLLVSPLGAVVGTIDPALSELGLSRRIALIVPDLVAVPGMLRSSDLITALARRTAQQLAASGGLCVMPSPLALPTYQVSMAWHARDDRNPAKTWLRDLVVEVSAHFRATE